MSVKQEKKPNNTDNDDRCKRCGDPRISHHKNSDGVKICDGFGSKVQCSCVGGFVE